MNDKLKWTECLTEARRRLATVQAEFPGCEAARNDFSPSAPPPRDVGAEGAQTLAAQIQLAPDQYAATAKYQPAYTALNLQSIRDTLMGTGGAPGLIDTLSQATPALQASGAAANTASRTADIADVAKLGPEAVAALRSANPTSTALSDELNSQALSQLKLGATLDPSLARQVSQSVRAGQSDRGFGYGQNDVAQEALITGLTADQLRQSRQGFASQVAGLNAATQQDPFLAILGRPSQATGAAQAILGQGAATGGASSAATQALFNPFNPYSSDVYNTNYNANAAARIAGSNNVAGVVGGALSV